MRGQDQGLSELPSYKLPLPFGVIARNGDSRSAHLGRADGTFHGAVWRFLFTFTPRPSSLASPRHHPLFLHGQEAVLGDDEMVKHSDAEDIARTLEPLRHGDVFGAGFQCS